jgi:uncharacterized protein (TIGR02217 family)
MPFLEVQFPKRVAYGFAGGPTYSTSIAVVASGLEQRNVRRSLPLGKWTATHQHKGDTDTQELIAFFHTVKGRAYGFRFFDRLDSTAGSGEGVLAVAESPANTYLMFREYAAGALSSLRRITKPIDGSITVSGGGTYAVDYTNGTILHSGGGAPTGWTGSFDVPCRFDSDEMKIEIVERGPDGYVYTWGDISIVEIIP